jgi:hypothetical protein
MNYELRTGIGERRAESREQSEGEGQDHSQQPRAYANAKAYDDATQTASLTSSSDAILYDRQ